MSGPIRNPFSLLVMFLKSAAFYLFRTPTPPKDRFDLLYSVKNDPWKYHSSQYEYNKYKDTLSLLKTSPYGKVLEMGCSIGVLTGMLAPYCKELAAVDASKVALELASKNCEQFSHIKFYCMDLFNDPVHDKFNLIVCSEILYYLDDRCKIKEMMFKMADWLFPGGYLLLTHMRRKSEDGVGFGRSLLGFPAMGAVSVHGIFKEDGGPFKLIQELTEEYYIVSLFQKQEKVIIQSAFDNTTETSRH